ncbi:TPA: LysR family transcriptional regulator [Citrobacter farmeri]|uniref:LysR family transcriptional regulator n=1 Tax=Citrobacter farmeri TaxID=67824 RepID=UPI00189F8AAF|nr:LysR family transcriptional regulator [Citrobacter farmeri]MBU5648584.1 LysR family transcriptional regulator [Pluralibacter sp. S54_ASV_43]HAT3754173.1 LysR family transcriptional regulator [Citrobacter amalonaticus]HAU5705914.1 LysR family transcriptional regulator [Citrobacter freundii]EKU0081741.1 LysR family transcriptional regulator [Citrobacter farmeri]MDB2179633.1 LysR family transcriptional regulator [Citrobacter farmeri]
MKDINFDFKQLQAFLAVIETGSFTAAAKKLSLTQSSISQQIANLENGLKTEVINRSQRPIQMTIAGQALYPLGKKIIDSGIYLQEHINAISHGHISHLKIGFVDSIGKSIGLDILTFLQPQVKHIFQVTGTASGLLAALNTGSINLAITMLHTEMPPNVRMYPLIEEEFLCVCPKAWPETRLEELCKNRDYIAYTRNTPTGIQTLNWLKWNNLSPSIQFEMDNADDILKLIACGCGWTLTTPLFITTIPAFTDALKIIRINNRKERRKIVLLCKDDELSEFYKNLAIEVRTILETKLEQGFYRKLDSDEEVSS